MAKELSRVYDELSDLRKGKLPLGGTSPVGDGWGYGVFGTEPEQPSNAGWDRNLSFGLAVTGEASQFAKDLIARAEDNFDNGDVSTPL